MAVSVSNIEQLSMPFFDLSFPSPVRGTFDLIGVGEPPVVKIPPVVSNVSPTPGTNIGVDTVIGCDVTDEVNSFRRIILVAYFPLSKIKEVCYDGAGFGPMYQNAANTATAISLGVHFNLSRDGGWLPNDGPVLIPFVIDTTGEENV